MRKYSLVKYFLGVVFFLMVTWMVSLVVGQDCWWWLLNFKNILFVVFFFNLTQEFVFRVAEEKKKKSSEGIKKSLLIFAI